MEWFITTWLLTNNPPPEKHAPAFVSFVILLLFGPACTGDSTCRGGWV